MSSFFKKPVTNIYFFLLGFFSGCDYSKNKLPDGFVYLTDIDPTITEDVRYSTKENFLGKPVDGYLGNRIICTRKAAIKLKLVHDDLKKQGYQIVIYDGYRPQTAVNDFIKWGKDITNQCAKSKYYPTINKKDVFKLGFVAQKSSHSRGSTFDLTLIEISQNLKPVTFSTRILNDGQNIPYLNDNTVDMGSSFDLCHEVSNHDSKLISKDQLKKRNVLRNAMKKHGFKDYAQEWWHYTLADEPYPDTYYDFPIQ